MYRASQVLNKPLDELSSPLGFDIPVTPIIDLASIKADGAIVHWTLPEKLRQKSTMKFEIHLNGAIIDSVSCHESAVTITGLYPRSFYVLRVALINSLEFSSKSTPVRFRTKPAVSGDFFAPTPDGHETDHDGPHEPVPRVRPYRGLKDITPASPTSASMAREGSAGLAPRRTISGRRPSPSTLGLDDKHDPQPDDGEAPEGAETIQQLTEKLDAIRRENDEAERQAKEEEEEELRQKEELAKERDELKAEATEKEKASRNLKREVNTLERQNTAAQNERSKQERHLQQKRQERQKLKDDLVRWEQEADEMRTEVERIQQDKSNHLEQVAKEKERLRTRHTEEATHARTLDDRIKEKTSEVKKVERALKNNSPTGTGTDSESTNLVQQYQHDAEEERAWQMHKQAMASQYSIAHQKLESTNHFYAEQMRYLDSLRAERRRQEEMAQQQQQYASPGAVLSTQTQESRLPRRADSQRSRQAVSRHSASDSPRLGTFASTAVNSQSPFASSVGPVGGGGFAGAPFLNIHNGMTIAGPTEEVAISEEEREKLTGGAAMSPSAGAELLPADLFSGDGDNKAREHVQPLPGLGSLPGLPGIPGPLPPTQAQHDISGPPGPASPSSPSSRSPSVFASPQASQHNLHLGSPEGVMDADRRSIRSTRSHRATSGGGTGITSSRFSGMFGIKQRNKALSQDEAQGLPLGKASSMPRQDQGLPGLDSAARKRNSSISGAVFGGGPTMMDGASDATTSADSSANAPLSRRAFGLFSKDKSGGWPSSFAPFGRRPTSPRPGSTHSNELPRPSMDSSRWGVDTWPSGDAASGARSSPLAFGPGWNLPGSQQPRVYGSRHPSRRPSVQYGAASGPPEDIIEDDDDSDALDGPDQASHVHLAPIGTRPSNKKAAEKEKPTLNPNAKDFKSFFSSMKIGSKDKASAKDSDSGAADGNSTPMPSASTTPNFTGMAPEDDAASSPPNSCMSRDARSMTTTESSLTAESGGRTSSDGLARTPSYSNSDAPMPSPLLAGSKEGFIQKLARKSSSGKFSLPTFKREKSRLGGLDTLAPTTSAGSGSATWTPQILPPAEDEEDAMSASVGSLREKEKDANRSSRNWSSVLKLGKKQRGGVETPSVSEFSTASGTGTETETEDGEEEEDG